MAGRRITPEQTPKDEHVANGTVEEAGKTMRACMARVRKIQIDVNIKKQLEIGEPIV